MSAWPPISEPELLERLAMDDERFGELLLGLLAALPPRSYDAGVLARAIAYPWTRPPGSYILRDTEVELLAELSADARECILSELTSAESGRSPLLAIGSNAAPNTLKRKFAHFDTVADRTVLAVTGHLREFDVGVAANPTVYGSMPATIFPSPGTAVRSTVLWVTPEQFTQLTWSELTYRLGRLHTRFEVDDGDAHFDEAMVFVSRFGAFCVDGRPVALAAIPADSRTARALSQEEMLDAAAALALGPGADAEALVRAVYEEIEALLPKLIATVRNASLPFESERWTPFGQP